MSDLVGEAIVELRGDDRRLRADIRKVAREGGKDFGKGFDAETRKGLKKSFADSLLSAATRATAVLNIAGAVGPAILAIGSAASAAAAGVTAVAGALGPALVAGAAAGAGALAAIAVGALGVKVAFTGFGKAIGGDAEALKALSPPARDFAKSVTALKPRLEAIRTTLQTGMFAHLGADTRQLANVFFPRLRAAAKDLGAQLGSLADQGTRMVASGPWRRDFTTVAANNTRNLGLFGRAGLQLADAFRSLFVTAQPLIHSFAEWALQASKGVNATVQAARASGNLQSFWARAATVGAQLAAIIGNLTAGLFNIFKIGAGSAGTGMLDNLQGMAKAFRAWTTSAPGIAKITTFFEQGRTNLAAMGRLLGATTKGLSTLGSGQQLAPLVDQIRSELLPPILEFLRNANVSGALSSLVSALASLARVFAALSNNDSSLKAFSVTLRLIGDAALWVVQHVPGAASALSVLFTALGAAAALRLVGLGGVVRGLGTAFGIMGTRMGVAAGLATTETGAITLNTLAHQASSSTMGTWIGVKALEAAAWVRSTAAARIFSSVLATTGGKLGTAAVGIAGVTAAAKSGGGALGFLGGAASGAMSGAALGSFIGPEGTALGAVVGGLAGGFLGLGHNTQVAGDAAKIATGSFDSLRSTLDQVTGSTTAATKAMVFQDLEKSGVLKQLRDYGISARDAVQAIAGGGSARAKFKADLDSQAAALTQGTAAAKKYLDSLDAGTTDPKVLKAANDNYQAIKKNNDARLAGINAIRKETGTTDKAVASMKAQIVATRTFTKAITSLPPEVVTELKTKVLGRADLVEMIAKYHLVPKKVATLITENGGTPTAKKIASLIAAAKVYARLHPSAKFSADTSQARAEVDAFVRSASARHITITVTAHQNKLATGGPARAGQTYLVGEEGPELVSFSRNAYVTNATDTARALANSGSKHSKAAVTNAQKYGRSVIAALAAGIKAGAGKLIPALQTVATNFKKLNLSKAVKKDVAALTTAYTTASDKLKTLRSDIAAFKTDFLSTALSSVQVRGFDPKDIVDLFTADTAQEESFLQGLAALGKAELNKSVLGTLQQAGVGALPQVQGILAGGKATIAALNAQTASLTSVAKAAGVTVSETMFGNGVQMASGLIKGLQSQQANLVKQMQALARAAVKAIRRELHMHSPSKVLTAIGVNGGRSLGDGFGSQVGHVESSAARLAKAAISGASSSTVRSGFASGTATAQRPIEIHAHLPTGDTEAAALAVWDRLVAAGVGG